eukprot:COSAG01_NODE_1223_length_11148_cov_73.655444_6_plen_69_part_00
MLWQLCVWLSVCCLYRYSEVPEIRHLAVNSLYNCSTCTDPQYIYSSMRCGPDPGTHALGQIHSTSTVL